MDSCLNINSIWPEAQPLLCDTDGNIPCSKRLCCNMAKKRQNRCGQALSTRSFTLQNRYFLLIAFEDHN